MKWEAKYTVEKSDGKEVEPKEVNEEGIRLCHATGIA